MIPPLRPLHDWLLVKVDPPREKVGSLFAPGGDAGRVRTAVVLRKGPGRALPNGHREPIAIEPGDHVAFFREHQEHLQGKQLGSLLQELGESLAIIRLPDVLFTWPQGVTLEVD